MAQQRSIILDPELDSFVSGQVQSGQFANEAEVIAAGLRTLRRAREDEDAVIARLNYEIDKGLASGVAPDGVLDRVRQRAGLPPRGDH